jgi:hypothetical protein
MKRLIAGAVTAAALIAPGSALAASSAHSTTTAKAAAAATENRTLCRSASIRAEDKAHVRGYAQAGDLMEVDHYAHHTNPSGGTSIWAYGTVHTQAGLVTGYVLYDGGTFC